LTRLKELDRPGPQGVQLVGVDGAALDAEERRQVVVARNRDVTLSTTVPYGLKPLNPALMGAWMQHSAGPSWVCSTSGSLATGRGP
jgi:hypothetical protein